MGFFGLEGNLNLIIDVSKPKEGLSIEMNQGKQIIQGHSTCKSFFFQTKFSFPNSIFSFQVFQVEFWVNFLKIYHTSHVIWNYSKFCTDCTP